MVKQRYATLQEKKIEAGALSEQVIFNCETTNDIFELFCKEQNKFLVEDDKDSVEKAIESSEEWKEEEVWKWMRGCCCRRAIRMKRQRCLLGLI